MRIEFRWRIYLEQFANRINGPVANKFHSHIYFRKAWTAWTAYPISALTVRKPFRGKWLSQGKQWRAVGSITTASGSIFEVFEN